MLSIIKRKKKLIILTFLLLDIFITSTVHSGQYDSLYNDFHNDSESYKSENKINEIKNTAPQYDENKANYQDAKDQESANRFMDYGTELTDSCTVQLYEQEKTYECKEEEDITYDFSNGKSEILSGEGLDGIQIQDGKIRFYDDDYGTGSWVSLTGSGRSGSNDGIQISNEKIRVYDGADYSGWISFKNGGLAAAGDTGIEIKDERIRYRDDFDNQAGGWLKINIQNHVYKDCSYNISSEAIN
ncbi:hypothetical protein [Flexistipes sp.]|uniref:hypothetical protein n=1 Tax=Flexistipes sp. TaxID=3088135 RepID=UPI002E24495D|nr:hypothetical protein [Flexistipes sp.]